jgi:PAS domain S-box-containing protein
MGIITNSNSEVTRILGFSKSDVVGQKVQRIMPKVFADMHDNFIKNFLETSESKILGIERLVLA